METEKQKTKTNLMFDMHTINTALNNLNFSLIYQDMENDNPQHYLKQLIEKINEINFNNYINL